MCFIMKYNEINNVNFLLDIRSTRKWLIISYIMTLYEFICIFRKFKTLFERTSSFSLFRENLKISFCLYFICISGYVILNPVQILSSIRKYSNTLRVINLTYDVFFKLIQRYLFYLSFFNVIIIYVNRLIYHLIRIASI